MSDSVSIVTPRDLAPLPGRLSTLLGDQAVAFDRLARGVRRKATEDGVHDLRVLTRRLRSILQLCAALLPASSLRDLRRRLRKLGRRLGDLRVLDVATRDAKTWAIDASALAPKRGEASEALVHALRPERRIAVVRGLRETSRKLRGATGNRVEEALDRRAEKLRKALDRAPEGKPAQHNLRIQVKKARYALEAIGRDAEALKPLQRHLGRSHDLEVLQELLGDHALAARQETVEREAARRLMKDAVAKGLEALS